ncbi:MAG: AAA family ATPase [Candidatus Pacebacteria bacterium]|nr:AAA family ATPase [Candidatus Paceibacterota bacterium]
MQTKTMTKTAIKQKTGNFGNFFMEVSNTKPYFKAAFEGFAGSGKTYTSALVAIGLHQKIKSKKPIVMFDTEKAAKFLKRVFKEAGIELLVKESRTLADLKESMRIMREQQISDIFIIDSISHVWEDTVEAYKRKMNRNHLQFQDWGVLKPMWKSEFSDPLVRDPYHIIMCGRAGYEYENEINSDTGKREIYKSGVKMKVEGETAYEPDILVLMERFEEILGKDKKVYRQATVVKDRSTQIDGMTFINPSFENFEPAIDDMLADPDAREMQETDSSGLFKTEEDKREYIRNKEIVLEKISNELVKAWPSTGAADKKSRIEISEKIFNTNSWEEIKRKGLDELEAGLEALKIAIQDYFAEQFPDKAEEKKTATKKTVKTRKEGKDVK